MEASPNIVGFLPEGADGAPPRARRTRSSPSRSPALGALGLQVIVAEPADAEPADAQRRRPVPPRAVLPAHAGIQIAAPRSEMGTQAGHVSLLASRRNGTLYLGVTSDLVGRIRQHKAGTFDGFSKRHGVTQFAWFERHDRIADAIAREKQVKKWRRAWKLELIETLNPSWADLYETVMRGE